MKGAPMIRFDDELSAFAKSGVKSGRPGPGDSDAAAGAEPANPFGRLVEIWKGSERLLTDLKALRPKIEGTLAYLATPGCPNSALGRAYLGRLEERQRAALEGLREHRREAHRLLRPAADAPAPAGPR